MKKRRLFKFLLVLICVFSHAFVWAEERSSENQAQSNAVKRTFIESFFKENNKPPEIKVKINVSDLSKLAPSAGPSGFSWLRRAEKLTTALRPGILRQRNVFNCSFSTADDLLAQCPSSDEMRQIKSDFNISFDNQLVERGVLVPWACTNGGSESSLMLSVYNAFRLMKCIPFQANFPWAPEHNNLYDWLKDRGLISIDFFWANGDSFSNGWDKMVHLTGNSLGDGLYRQVIEAQSGVGLIYLPILIAHEARHADINIGHNCDTNDTNIEYGGAWSVQYFLMGMLAEETGNYFSPYEKEMLNGDALHTYNTCFCDYAGH